MNINQIERKLDRTIEDNNLRKQVMEAILDRIHAFNFSNSSLEDVEIYCVLLNVGGIKYISTIKGRIVVDMLDKSYISSRELICTSNWNFKRILRFSFKDDGDDLQIKVNTLKRKELHATLFDTVEPKELMYTVILSEKDKFFGKVQVDLSYFEALEYDDYLACLVDAFHRNTKIKKDSVDLTAYKFHIVNYA